MKITLKVDTLKEIFKSCKTFVSKAYSGKPILEYIQLNCQYEKCYATALDGIKLMTISVPFEAADEGIMYIPIVKLPKNGVVTISDEGNEILFDFNFGTEKQFIRKIEGDFPSAIDRLFPSEEPILKIGFDPKVLRDALDGFTNETTVKLEFVNPIKGCVITGTTKKALVLPVKLKDYNN